MGKRKRSDSDIDAEALRIKFMKAQEELEKLIAEKKARENIKKYFNKDDSDNDAMDDGEDIHNSPDPEDEFSDPEFEDPDDMDTEQDENSTTVGKK